MSVFLPRQGLSGRTQRNERKRVLNAVQLPEGNDVLDLWGQSSLHSGASRGKEGKEHSSAQRKGTQRNVIYYIGFAGKDSRDLVGSSCYFGSRVLQCPN